MPIGDEPLTITLTTNALHPDDVMVGHDLPPAREHSAKTMKYLNITNEHRKLIHATGSSPLLSSFVVSCTITFLTSTSSSPSHITTTNSEPCSLPGSICAERAALSSILSLNPTLTRITGVYILSDSPAPITPGFMCREYMNTRFPTSIMDPSSVPVTLAGVDAASDTVDYSTVTSSLLSTYWPAPSLNTHVRTATAPSLQLSYCPDVLPPDVAALYTETKELAAAPCAAIYTAQEYHKRQYAMGILWSDGTTSTTLQINGLEYGTSIEPLHRLSERIDGKFGEGEKIVAVIYVDDLGGAHAPFAVGRAYLSELRADTGVGDAVCYYHRKVAGGGVVMEEIKVAEICTDVPAFQVEDLTT